MDLEYAYNILDLLQTMWDAAKQMEKSYAAGKLEEFHSLSMDLQDGLAAVLDISSQEIPGGGKNRLADACICALESLKNIRKQAITKPEKVAWKLAYELEPIIETMAMQFYYWGIVAENPEKWEEFQEFLKSTEAFDLLKNGENGQEYPCDLVIQVLAYNQLDYTARCVESILSNLPSHIRTELQLYNHGSSDGTQAYFESIENAKVINIAVNGAMPGAYIKAVARGRYCLFVSNDIVIGVNAIENLYRCVMEHEDYGYIVPTTPAVSNHQRIPAGYPNEEEFVKFTRRNNVYDTKRHEQRTRLCNPVCILPSLLYERMLLDMYQETFCSVNPNFSFPDDRISLWMRRNGYQNILAKDAFCHHFGSVTIKEENKARAQQELELLYTQGRKDFKKRYGVDPWGTGFCYDWELFDILDIRAEDGVSILGLNCGMGSNSLKVKEILREKGAENIILYNGTQKECFLKDLQGVSDHAFLFSKLSDIVPVTGRKKFRYIVVEEPVEGIAQEELPQKIQEAGIEFEKMAYKKPDGWDIVKL